MARREILWTAHYGRDEGKQFVIREMDAFTCEQWSRRAISAVYRCATESDQGIMALMSQAIRQAFMTPQYDTEVKNPSDGPLPEALRENILQERRREAEEESKAAREDAPTQLVATLGIRLFFQLPPEEQFAVLRPLLSEVFCINEAHLIDRTVPRELIPVMDKVGGGVEVSERARLYIEEPQTIMHLEMEAFRLNAGFFTNGNRSISDEITRVIQRRSHE